MPDAKLLETFESPTSEPFLIEHIHEEFTSVCPLTGHPDFGRITIRYEPNDLCIELKSLKLYYHSFRNEGAFYEAVTNQILDDLVTACQPRRMTVTGDFRPRGGISTVVTANYAADDV